MEQNKELMNVLKDKYPLYLESSTSDLDTLIMFRGIFTEGYNLAKEHDADLLKALQDLVKDWDNITIAFPVMKNEPSFLAAKESIIKAGGSI